jgi:hypothetical protein
MSIRKCIYTNRPAKGKDRIIPKRYLTDQDEKHNWTNYAPISWNYRNFKKDRLPTELEFEANELFHFLELAQLKLKFYRLISKNSKDIQYAIDNTEYYQGELVRIQQQLNQPVQDKEIETAQHEYQILEESDKDIKKELKKRKKIGIWE